MKSTEYVTQAIEALKKRVENIVLNPNIDLQNKDKLMLPLSQERRVLEQTIEDLNYLKEHPPTQKSGCKTGFYRDEN